MKPPVLGVLPRLVTSCLVLACDGERKAEPASPADATVKAEVKPDATKTDANATKPDAAKTEVVEPEPSDPVPPRAVVFYRDAPEHRVNVWALPEATAPDPAAARDLGIVADDAGGSIHHGTGAPVLSGDGRWLAFLDDGRLELARLDGSARHRITKHRAHRVTVSISGFSPDSSALVFHQGEVQSEEGTALPKGVVEGFQWLALADRTIEPKPTLEAFRTFSDDGRHVIFERPDRTHTLVRFELATGTQEELQPIAEPFGFSQLVLHGDHIVYVLHPAKDKSQVVADVLGGGKRRPLSPEGRFAQYQWPKISLDGRHLTYTDETALLVRPFEGGETRTLTTCAQRCDHAWDGASTVIVLDGGQLCRVSLDGSVTPLATDVKGFVIAGAPG